jgi:hypothetical protein
MNKRSDAQPRYRIFKNIFKIPEMEHSLGLGLKGLRDLTKGVRWDKSDESGVRLWTKWSVREFHTDVSQLKWEDSLFVD